MYADLGTLTIPSIANSMPWLTYLNTNIIIVILIKIFKCLNPYPFVYSANLQSTKALPTPTMGTPSLQQVDTYLDSIVTICLILLLIIVIAYIYKKPRKIIQTSTILKIILFSDNREIGLPLGKTLFKIDRTSQLTSENISEKPILTLRQKLNINWQGHVLKRKKEILNYLIRYG
jgi:cbb3-type cytochrome oxidase subunit 3